MYLTLILMALWATTPEGRVCSIVDGPDPLGDEYAVCVPERAQMTAFDCMAMARTFCFEMDSSVNPLYPSFDPGTDDGSGSCTVVCANGWGFTNSWEVFRDPCATDCPPGPCPNYNQHDPCHTPQPPDPGP